MQDDDYLLDDEENPSFGDEGIFDEEDDALEDFALPEDDPLEDIPAEDLRDDEEDE